MYASAFMKNRSKKIPVSFRIDADLEAKIRKASRATGMSQTAIVEDALHMHFAKFAEALP